MSVAFAGLLIAALTGSEPNQEFVRHEPPLGYDYSHPIEGGAALHSTQQAAPFLSFAPSVPRFGVDPSMIQISNADSEVKATRGVIFVYHLPSIGYVNVHQRHPAGETVERMASVAQKYRESVDGELKMVSVDGLPAMFLSDGQGKGALKLIKNGYMFDILGPKITLAEITTLARLVG